MDSIQFSEFSTVGVNISDTFDIWRQKTNGVVTEVADLRNDISPLFYNSGQNTSTLRTVTLDTPQTISGAKTFDGGTLSAPALKVGAIGFYENNGALSTTTPIHIDKLILQSQLQFGEHSYGIPTTNPSEASILGKSGNSLTWTTLNSIISQIQIQGAANVVTTNIVLPVGSIQAYSSATAPTGWLACDGSRFQGSAYTQLATLLLNTYAPIYTTQTGSTVASNVSYNPNWWYTLPDLRGRFTLGAGSGNDGVNPAQSFTLGASGGKYAHSLITAELPSHSHTISSAGAHSHQVNLQTGVNYDSFLAFGRNDINSELSNDGTGYGGAGVNGNDRIVTIAGVGDHTHSIGNTGSGTAHSIVQPYIVTNYIIKATPDSVINTFIDRGNVFDIIRDSESLQSLSIANGGTGVLNLRHDQTLTINTDRQLGVAPLAITADKIANGAIDSSKLSFGGPSWDSTTATLYEGADPNTRKRVATREYVDALVFKKGPAAKLVTKSAHSPYSSASTFGEFCYINHDGVPIITGVNTLNRFGFADKFSHCEMPLPDNRKAVQLHIGQNQMCVLDDVGELWALGTVNFNMFNIVPWPVANTVSALAVKEWTKAYSPVYSYSLNNKIAKVVMSGNRTISNVAIIDTSNRLWISGNNVNGILGRAVAGATTATSTKIAGEATPILENVIDAILIGSGDTATCVALTPTGIRVVGYGGSGQRGDGFSNISNTTFNTVTISGINDYSTCKIYAAGEGTNTTLFLTTDNENIVYGWGYNVNGILGDNTISNKNRPIIVWENPDLNIDKIYTTSHATPATYIFGSKNNATTKLGLDITSTVSGHLLGTALSCNDTGNIIAIGAPGVLNGRVQCYEYSGTAWNPYGAIINGAENASNFGKSVSLSSSGNRLAIGIPDGQRVGTEVRGQVRIYDYSSGSWTQLGVNLTGENKNFSKFGSSVALSGNGNVLIVGAPGTNRTNGLTSIDVGQVFVYSLVGTNATLLGSTIFGSGALQMCGSNVAINTDGTIIAISSRGTLLAGVVRIYQLQGNNWIQLGGDIIGRNNSDNAMNISLNGLGTRICIGAPGTDANGSNSGQTRIFNYDPSSSTWIQIGEINGAAIDAESGTSVSMSRDGNTVAIGSPNTDTLGKTDNGYVRLYRLVDGVWKLLTANIAGENINEKSGTSTSLSSNGNTLIVGAPQYNLNRGLVRAITFVSEPTSTNELWCSGKNIGNKFALTGDSNQWRQVGPLPSGYTLKDFWCGNGHESNNINIIKAYRTSDNKYYLFACGTNSAYQSGNGSNTALNVWTRINLSSDVVEKIVDLQTASSITVALYTILLLDDGSLYFSGYNAYMIDPNLPNNTYRTDFTRIK